LLLASFIIKFMPYAFDDCNSTADLVHDL